MPWPSSLRPMPCSPSLWGEPRSTTLYRWPGRDGAAAPPAPQAWQSALAQHEGEERLLSRVTPRVGREGGRGWEQLTLQYAVPWPLHLVVTSQVRSYTETWYKGSCDGFGRPVFRISQFIYLLFSIIVNAQNSKVRTGFTLLDNPCRLGCPCMPSFVN